MERLIAACTNCAVAKAPCRIKGKICAEFGHLIASNRLPRRGSNDAPKAGAAGLRENAPVERLIAACTNCAVAKAPCRIKCKIRTESGHLIASKSYPGGSKPPPYDYIVGSPKRQKPFWGEETLRNARGVDFVKNPPQAIWSQCRRGRGGYYPPANPSVSCADSSLYKGA